MALSKSQITITRLIVLLVCLGAIGWMWRQSERSRRPPTASTWVEKLQSGDPDERKYAIQELSAASRADAESVAPALIGAFGDPAKSVRNEAVLALGSYLAATAKDRGSALTDQYRTAASRLLDVVKGDSDSSVCASAAFAVATLHRALGEAGIKPDQSQEPDSIDPKTMAHAFNTVLARDPSIRHAILVPYEHLGPIGEPAPDVLLAALDDPSADVRKLVFQVLSQFTSGADRAVPVLLKDAEIKPPPSGIQQTKGLTSESPLQRAAKSLHPTGAVVPILAKALESKNPDVREAAVSLLGQVGPDARSTSPALIAAAKESIHAKGGQAKREGPGFSDYATTIAQIVPAEEAVAFLSQAMGNEDRAIRIGAATALGKVGPKGDAAVPVLVKALKSASNSAGGRGDGRFTAALLESLGQIGPVAALSKPAADEVIAALSPFLESPQAFMRITAAKALGDFGPRAVGALPKLRALAENEKATPAAREAASDAIGKIDAAAKKTEPEETKEKAPTGA
jgi:HEAT repeat protein